MRGNDSKNTYSLGLVITCAQPLRRIPVFFRIEPDAKEIRGLELERNAAAGKNV
jgi:hypothetical protein